MITVSGVSITYGINLIQTGEIIMKRIVRCAHEFMYHNNVEIRYDTKGVYYAFMYGHRIEHPDLEELERRIDEILLDQSNFNKYMM